MRRIKGLFVILLMVGGVCPTVLRANVTSKSYVDDIVSALNTTVGNHVADKTNPHAVTAAQVGLGNVKNVDQTNADNLASGTVSYGLLPVGDADSTIAAGDDVRFDTISTVAPTGTPPSGRVYIWFN